MKILAVAVMVVICIALCLHWGFLGVVASSCIYGLWANNSEDAE